MSLIPSGDEFTINLEGGGPWGFTLQGGADFRSPLKVGKVTPGGKAQNSGLVAGDIIVSINGVGTSSMKHYEAQRLIVASRKTLQLVCDKAVLQSPKSSSQLMSFAFPSPPRSTTPSDDEFIDKTKSLGRHARQGSLDLQSYRSRSYSDAKRKPVVGDHIAGGVRVPAPPPKAKRKSDPVTIEQRIPRYVAGIRVPAPPPSLNKPSKTEESIFMTTTDTPVAVTTPESSISITTDNTPPVAVTTPESSVSITTDNTPPVAVTTPESSVSITTDNTPPVAVTTPESSVSVTIEDTPPVAVESSTITNPPVAISTPAVIDDNDQPITEDNDQPITEPNVPISTNTTEDIPPISITAASLESEESQSSLPLSSIDISTVTTSEESSLIESPLNKGGVSSPDSHQSFDETQSSGYKSINSSSEEDILTTSGSGTDWYKSMFQSMKKGVEEQIPNKKHVCDRSPTPARKTVFNEKTTSPLAGNLNIGGNSVGTSSSTRRSSESSLNSPPARSYQSMTRTSSSGTVDAVNSLNSGVVFRKNIQTYNHSRNYWKSIEKQASQERVEIAAAAAKRNSLRRNSSSGSVGRVVSPDIPETSLPITSSGTNSSSVLFDTSSYSVFQEEESSEGITDHQSQPQRVPSPLKRSPSPVTKTPPPKTPPPKTPPPITPPLRTTPPLGFTKTLSPKTPPPKTPPPRTPPLRTPSPILHRTPSPRSTETKTPPINSVTPPIRSPQLNSVDFDESMSKLHPLLKEGSTEEQQSTSQNDIPQQDLFSRIDATKLNSAIGNATILGKMEQEGASAVMLQSAAKAVGQKQEEQPVARKKKSKTVKPPPGEKAKGLYDFQSASEKEVSFKKGDIITLTEQVDANWLKGTVNGTTGIFPITFVKVLTSEEIAQLAKEGDSPSPPPSLNLLAKAKYDFTAKSSKELSFNKHDIITLIKQIDDNWYQGVLGDNKGIVPVTYIQIYEGEDH